MMVFVSVLFLLIISSCNNEKRKPLETSAIKLNKIDSLSFDLDEFSTGRNNSTLFTIIDGKEYFSFLNTANNSIYFYDFNTKDLGFKLEFKKDGPLGVGSISHYSLLGLDSLYLYSYNTAILYLTDSSGNIHDKFSVESKSSEYVRPQLNSTRPLIVLKDLIILNSWGSNKEYYHNMDYIETNFLFHHVDENIRSYKITYPKIYTKGIWGVQYYQIFHDFNPDTKSLILSYPIDDSVYVYDLEKNKLTGHLMNGGEEIKIEPLSVNKKMISIPIMEEVNKQLMQYCYNSVKFHKEKDWYMRILYHPVDIVDIENKHPIKSRFPPQSLIFYDSKFNFLGKFKLPEYEYFTGSIFFHGDHLYIERLFPENEDLLIFDKFNVSF